ncbi:hypothetical protein ACFWBF_34665 [Streptomyces sp. NPDC060028]
MGIKGDVEGVQVGRQLDFEDFQDVNPFRGNVYSETAEDTESHTE